MNKKGRVRNTQPDTCVFPSCKSNALARDLCSGHYKQYMKGKTLYPIKKRAKRNELDHKECDIEKCSNKARSKGLCLKHYIQLKRILWKKKKNEEGIDSK